MSINISFENVKTERESQLMATIQYLADIINHIGCQEYINDMTESLHENEVSYSFGEFLE